MRSFVRRIVGVFALLTISQAAFGEPPGGNPPPRPRWKTSKVRIAVSNSVVSADNIITSNSDALEAVTRGINAWQGVANIELVTEFSENENASVSGSTGDGISLITIAPTQENVLLFGKDDLDAAAKTRVFYNRRGFITEADIVLNPYQQFSTDGRYGTFDLEGVIVHEVGHLLGLRHSDVRGSMMYRTTSKNISFGEEGSNHREISTSDVAALRELYVPEDLGDCCGTISGKLLNLARTVRAVDVWAEDVDTGQVAAQTSARDGIFRIGGLRSGSFIVYARSVGKGGESSMAEIGVVKIAEGETRQLTKRLNRQLRDFSLSTIGVNGILNDSGVRLVPGRTYTLYAGGTALKAIQAQLFTLSPYISVDQGSIRDLDYGEGIYAVSFDITIDREAPPGNYSLYGSSSSGGTDALVGGITIVTDQRDR